MKATISRGDFLRKWVDALRSGRYTQRSGYLNKDGRFCCVGVACEVLIQSGTKLPRNSDTHSGAVSYGDGFSCSAPVELLHLLPGVNFGALYGMNDDRGMTFEEIAQYIDDTYISPKGAL